MNFLTRAELRDRLSLELDRGDDPDMPVFLLKGTDPNAPTVIRIWASLTSALYRNTPSFMMEHIKPGEAYFGSREMDEWQKSNKTKLPD